VRSTDATIKRDILRYLQLATTIPDEDFRCPTAIEVFERVKELMLESPISYHIATYAAFKLLNYESRKRQSIHRTQLIVQF
jgi:hypothetical protein